MAKQEETIEKLKNLVKEADDLVGKATQVEEDVESWEKQAPIYQGWVTSATALVKTISFYTRQSGAILYANHVEKIADKAERNSLDDAVKDIAQILQRLIGDIEDGTINMRAK